ncbi:hypothetical protein MJA45_04095 [Paenibacillus aurantius]|uniref:LppX_LprAFG lipoprotein n=1 Tax=Paenibacillus aurantius TaxID=2918900 RepID=A0AA96LFC8_9BACL|nr:DUF6612 family protein [Paenibacillus aurantius]WNQ12240.1 hypothetical protein MJA45_04095 [Paenibacillus aurantius]
MRRMVGVTLAALALLTTAACGSNAKELPKEEAVAAMAEKADKAANYQVKLRLTAQVKSGSLVQSEETVEGAVEYIAKEDPDLHSSYVTTNKGSGKQGKTELYKQGKLILSNENEQGWKDVSARLQKEELLKATHADLVEALRKIESELSVEPREEGYSLSYSGESGNVYEAFKKPFTINFKGVDQSQVHSDLKTIVDKETLFIRELHYEATANNAAQTVTLRVDLSYDQFNKINEVSIPQEIREAASQPSK